MNFDDLDREMRVFETAHDRAVLPELYIVARVDGRGFTRLTKEAHAFDAPFDERMREHMVHTTRHLMDCGFRTLYGYTQSDEISLLLHPGTDAFGRKTRKYLSLLAGEASAACSLSLGGHAVFDCRVSELPSARRVADYFRWRAEDARRNALNAHCYWRLRHEGQSADAATEALRRLPVAAKHDLLWQRGVNFNDLPAWQKRGVGVTWETFGRTGADPRTGEPVTTTRRRLATHLELPVGDAYGAFVAGLLAAG